MWQMLNEFDCVESSANSFAPSGIVGQCVAKSYPEHGAAEPIHWMGRHDDGLLKNVRSAAAAARRPWEVLSALSMVSTRNETIDVLKNPFPVVPISNWHYAKHTRSNTHTHSNNNSGLKIARKYCFVWNRLERPSVPPNLLSRDHHRSCSLLTSWKLTPVCSSQACALSRYASGAHGDKIRAFVFVLIHWPRLKDAPDDGILEAVMKGDVDTVQQAMDKSQAVRVITPKPGKRWEVRFSLQRLCEIVL